jgi:hypothetical protein
MVMTVRRRAEDPARMGVSSGVDEDPGGFGDIAARLA